MALRARACMLFGRQAAPHGAGHTLRQTATWHSQYLGVSRKTAARNIKRVGKRVRLRVLMNHVSHRQRAAQCSRDGADVVRCFSTRTFNDIKRDQSLLECSMICASQSVRGSQSCHYSQKTGNTCRLCCSVCSRYKTLTCRQPPLLQRRRCS